MKRVIIAVVLFQTSINIFAQFKVGANTKQIGNNSFFELESLMGSKVVITKDSGIMGIGTSTPLVDLDIVSKKVATNTINADFGLLRLARPTSTNVKWGHVAQFNLGSYTTGGAAHTRLDIRLNNDGNLTPSPILTLQGNGNVSIGNTAPLSRLHVTEPINNAAFQSVLTVDANPSTLGSSGFNGVNPDLAKMSSGIQFLGWNGLKEGGIFRQTGSGGKSHMLFTVNNTNDVAMVINEARRVGIGSIAPATTLHVQHANAVTNTINADAQILRLSRPSLTNVRWDNIAQFNLGSYATVAGGASTEARTRLDLALNDGNGLTTTNIMTWNASGNVGIGTTAPTSKLEVNGAATNTSALNAGSLTSIDFSASNIAFTSATATAIALNNLKDGGAYTLIFTSTAATGTVAFSATGFTFVYVGTEARTSGKKHIYSLIVAGSEVYVTMGTQN